MGRRIRQRTEDKHEYGEEHQYEEEQTKNPRKHVEQRRKSSGTLDGHFSYRRPTRLRHCRENKSPYPGEPYNRETKNRNSRSGREFQES